MYNTIKQNWDAQHNRRFTFSVGKHETISRVQVLRMGHIYIYMSLWQKVLPLNPGMFVYSYLFSSYYSYMKLWLLLFIMHWWVVKVEIGSFGHQEED